MSYYAVNRWNTIDHNRIDHNSFTNHSYNGNHESFLNDSAISHVDQYGALNINASPVYNEPVHDNDFSYHIW